MFKIIKITVVSISNNIRTFIFTGNCQNCQLHFRKSGKHVCITVEFRKLFGLWVIFKSMHEGLRGFLKLVLFLNDVLTVIDMKKISHGLLTRL